MLINDTVREIAKDYINGRTYLNYVRINKSLGLKQTYKPDEIENQIKAKELLEPLNIYVPSVLEVISHPFEPMIRYFIMEHFEGEFIECEHKRDSIEEKLASVGINHGDLWSKNMLINESGVICLIDWEYAEFKTITE